MPGFINLFVVIVIVLGVVGLAWWLLMKLQLKEEIKTVINVIGILGLVIWLLIWVLPRLLALVGVR